MSDDYTLIQMATGFAEVGHDLVGLANSAIVFDKLVHLAVERVPGAEHAGITRGTGSGYETVAATSDTVVRTDRIQYELQRGPCIDAVVQAAVFGASDLRVDPRWPSFGTRAASEEGVLSMLSLRLFLEDDTDIVASLNLYATRVGAFEGPSEAIALMLATYGALAVANAASREKATNLLAALKSSREIGVAMGVLMARHQATRDQAFDMLRLVSQHTHRKLADIATDVADTGVLAAIPSQRARA